MGEATAGSTLQSWGEIWGMELEERRGEGLQTNYLAGVRNAVWSSRLG